MDGKYMKSALKVLFVLLAVCLSTAVEAQDRRLREGDAHVERLAYAKAIPQYLKAAKKGNEEGMRKLAHCYYMVRDYEAAGEWYEKVKENESHSGETWFEYGHVLLQQQRYDEAKVIFGKAEAKGDQRGAKFAEALAHMDQWYKDTARYSIQNMSFNTASAEFGAFPYADGLVFASNRESGSRDNLYEGTNTPFLNLYFTKEKDYDRNKWGSPEALKGDIRSSYHESNFSMSESDSVRAWFSRNNFLDGKKKRSKDKLILLKIYTAEMDGKKGNAVSGFPYNSDEYSLTHPMVSPDGKTLFFSSDMPGGEGGKDLYSSTWDGSAWSPPQNLGPNVNTPADEVFPFLHPDGSFYFASNGHPGFGHLDIFKLNKLTDADRKTPSNLGAPVNSPFDDFGLYLAPASDKGFFSSNRPGGRGDDDVYAFTMAAPAIEIFVKDSISKFPIEQARVELWNKETDETASFLTDSLGRADFEINSNFTYQVKVVTPDFEDYLIDIDPNSEATGLQSRYVVSLYNPPPALTAVVVDDSTKQKLPGAIVTLSRKSVSDTIQRETDRYGRFSAKLRPLQEYDLTVQADGYYTYRGSLSTNKYSYDGDTIIPMKMKTVEVGEVIVLENINYDFDKWELRPEAMVELNRLAMLMQDNPDISIELGSHTDARGDNAYNLKLSEARARSARYYLVFQGIRPTRITYKGYGESMPLNRCHDGVSCSEEEHFENRRTEFKITGYKGKIQQK